MHYRAVGNRCAVTLANLDPSVTSAQAARILTTYGFEILNVDLVAAARACVGKSRYSLGVSVLRAPDVVDCSSFTRWLYAQAGVWIPRRSIQQRHAGDVVSEPQRGDLVFVRGYRNYYETDKNDEVGHVGVATGEGTVVHAASKKAGVVESPYSSFTRGALRGVRRMMHKDACTLLVPDTHFVETSDDVRWIVLRHS